MTEIQFLYNLTKLTMRRFRLVCKLFIVTIPRVNPLDKVNVQSIELRRAEGHPVAALCALNLARGASGVQITPHGTAPRCARLSKRAARKLLTYSDRCCWISLVGDYNSFAILRPMSCFL